MPASRRRTPKPKVLLVAEEQMILNYVQNADDDILQCRQKHDLPPLAFRNGRLPKNVSAKKEHDGCWRIVQYCRRNCGYYRFVTTLPGGTLHPADVTFESRYEKKGYLAKGVRIPPRYAYAEMWRRVLEELEARDASADGVPDVVFDAGTGS